MPWKCPQCGVDGLDDGLASHSIGAGGCGFSRFPDGLVLSCPATGKELVLRVPTTIGQSVLRILAPEESRFASSEQFLLEKSSDRGGWVVRPVPYATNATYLNDVPVPAGGEVLKTGDSLSIKGKYLALTIRLLDAA